MRYVDGYVLPVALKNVAAYRAIAKKAGKIWKEHGAISYVEAVGDDLQIEGMLPFTQAVKAKAGETVVFAFVVFKSRAHRDRVNAKVMQDKRLATICNPKKMPFNCKRIRYGGFTCLVAL